MELAVLIVVVGMALGFGFTNGFMDAANAIATSISTRALTPRTALGIAAVGNFVGTLVTSHVAMTLATDIISTPRELPGLVLVFSALAGAIGWNLIVWWFGIPSSSSHALIGGLVGAAIAENGFTQVKWDGVVKLVAIPTVVSPLVGLLAGYLAMVAIYWIFRHGKPARLNRGFRAAQVPSSILLALGHGAQDAQKTVGIVMLILVSAGTVGSYEPRIWVELLVAITISAGTYSGGWRIMRTLGRGIVTLRPEQGFGASVTSSVLLLANAFMGFAISTTHVVTSGVMGVGAARNPKQVRWVVAGHIMIAWIVTFSAAALFSASAYALSRAALSAFDTENGPLLPQWAALPSFIYWFLPIVLGLGVVVTTARRYPRESAAGPTGSSGVG